MGKLVIIACTNVGRSMIEAVLKSPALKDVELAGVVNMSPTAAIGKANYDSYIDLFEQEDINHYYCENVNEAECVAFLKDCEPDIIIQSGWSQKFQLFPQIRRQLPWKPSAGFQTWWNRRRTARDEGFRCS